VPAHPHPSAPLRVALLGLGTVGRDVARGLLERGADLAAAADGRELRLAAVGVRDPGRDRGLRLPHEVRRTEDLASLVASPRVDVVVELLGGLEPAGELVVAALDAGKAVVTANKALLGRRGAALEAHARRVAAPLRFEAAVAGGVPILGPLAADLAANRWTSVAGIVNGTTNFILTAMADEGWAYADALQQAQAAGLAEADPRADVEGHDAADKLAILARLAFGAWPEVAAIRRAPPATRGDGLPGITGVTPEVIESAADLGLVIKLLAQARHDRAGALRASVLPTAVPGDSALGRANGVTNLVVLQGQPIGRLTMRGPGAGGQPTSSAVLGDLLAIARGAGSTWAGLARAEALLPGAVRDGLDGPRRWLTSEAPGAEGAGGVEAGEPRTLAAERHRLAAAGWQGTLYPVESEA
jgi:homoserine dehydrogenase